ncbi:MAG: glycosyltransferase family 2 protein [Proteobacteria bacterium]|nr:glycosyltransferase family 2 protein [Pseudomonadota bacterium]MBU1452112.1 glycosyltransferase family 2 protein [Pseudomonadota bacterium]MBU2467507.1 glycosyltransferase family 2 protein [Pseudomonadota bacterium]MBU2517912.1 glycosyltransferase family 2 protein [Pseudomonadota bacterium]
MTSLQASHGRPVGEVWIILVNYNGLPHILDCLTSLKNQTYHEREIVVVDNASHDDSLRVIQRRFPWVRLLSSPINGGFAQGANLGLNLALEQGAQAAWLLNPDATAHPHALAALVRAMESDPRVGAVGSLLRWAGQDRVQAWGGGKVNLITGRSRHHTKPTPQGAPDYLCGASLLLRCQALRQVGLLDSDFPLYWEDADLCWRLRREGWRLAVAQDSLVEHRPSSGLAGDERAWHRLYTGGSVRFFRKHAPLPWLAVALSAGGRLARRAAQGRWSAVSGIWQGIFSPGWGRLP